MSAALAERAWCLVVPHHARGARLARHRLSTELSGEISKPLLADVLTVLGELVGNAVRHAHPLPGGVIRVAWALRPAFSHDAGLVSVKVTDGGGAPGVPHLRTVHPEAGDGRGLAIVAALADRWGVDRDGLGQSVWAELSTTTIAADTATRDGPGQHDDGIPAPASA